MISGSCLCGKVVYEIPGPGTAMYYCHCRMCRKASGSSFATNMLMKESDLVIRSGRRFIKGFSSSPGEVRYFCSACGSPLYGKAEARQGLVSLRCGGLDDAPGIEPQVHLFTHWKAPWYRIEDGLEQVPELPLPIAGLDDAGQDQGRSE